MSPSNNVIKTCSINICTFSERSKFTLDKYAHDEQFDAVFVQETGTTDLSKLKLTNMKVIADDNNARNNDAANFFIKFKQLSRNKGLGYPFYNQTLVL